MSMRAMRRGDSPEDARARRALPGARRGRARRRRRHAVSQRGAGPACRRPGRDHAAGAEPRRRLAGPGRDAGAPRAPRRGLPPAPAGGVGAAHPRLAGGAGRGACRRPDQRRRGPDAQPHPRPRCCRRWSRRFPQFRDTFARSARHAAQAQQLLDEIAREDLARMAAAHGLSIAALQALSRAAPGQPAAPLAAQRASALRPVPRSCASCSDQIAACTHPRPPDPTSRWPVASCGAQGAHLTWYNGRPDPTLTG